MSKFNFLRNAAGISLIEVMAAIAITGGLSLTVSKLLEKQSQGVKQTEAKSENMNIKGLIQDNLNNTTACQYTFSPITAAQWTSLAGSSSYSVTLPSVKDKLNAIKYSTASTDIAPLTITSIVLTNYNSGLATGDLVIQSTFKRSSTLTQVVKPIKIPINFAFTTFPTLSGCSTMAVGGEWMLGGNAATVAGTDYLGTSDGTDLVFKTNATERVRYTSAGNVGIGNTTPQSKLQLTHTLTSADTLDANNIKAMFRLGMTPYDDGSNRQQAAILIEPITNNAYGDASYGYLGSSLTTYNARDVKSSAAMNVNSNWAASSSTYGVSGSGTQGKADTGDQTVYGVIGSATATTAITDFGGSFVTGILRGMQASVTGGINVNPPIVSVAGPPAYTHPSVSAFTAIDITSGTFGGGVGNTYAGYFAGKVAITGNLGVGVTAPLSKLTVGNDTSIGAPDYSSGIATASIWGYSDITSGTAIYGKVKPNNSNSWQTGVIGACTGPNVSTYCTGVYGYGGYTTEGNGRSYGVRGNTNASGTAGWNYGVHGQIGGTRSAAAIFGTTAGDVDLTEGGTNTTRWAGYFNGPVRITGGITQYDWLNVTLSASAASGTGSWMKCRLDSVGNVHLMGYINKIASGGSSSQITMGTLPLDCRPRSAVDGVSAAWAVAGTGQMYDNATGTRRCFHIPGVPGDAYWDGRLQLTACYTNDGGAGNNAWGGSAFDGDNWWVLAGTYRIGEIIFSKLQ